MQRESCCDNCRYSLKTDESRELSELCFKNSADNHTHIRHIMLNHFEKGWKAAQSFRNLNELFEKPGRGRPSNFDNQSLLAAVEGNESLTFRMWIFQPSFVISKCFESRREDRHIVRNSRVQPTASSAAIQAQVAISLGIPVSARTIRRRLADGHLRSWCQLRVDPYPSTTPFGVVPSTRKLDCSEMEPGHL
ncbi:HTH_Tnp_Tc3_2 domain-containing protein [Trichonephila clavipes]|nr:HTH_Tnp_Tc3_2 domain-containing protein [Trichonephila clavipes]